MGSVQPMPRDGGAEIPKAGPFGSLLVQLAGLAFRRAKSEEEDDKDVRHVVHVFHQSFSG
jgi:hypothetical protein